MGDNELAVIAGLAKTGRLVTAAGLIMFAAFMGFVAGSIVGLQQFGFGLAAAIIIDVTIIRALLVPERDEAVRPLELVAAGAGRSRRPGRGLAAGEEGLLAAAGVSSRGALTMSSPTVRSRGHEGRHPRRRRR